jgi:hypothetical protein
MNNFTKEELYQIKFDMDNGQNRYDSSFTDEMYIALENKIQSMIDNYCEHESDGLIYTSNPPKNKCVKCEEFYQ